MTRPKKNVSELLDQRMVIMMSNAEIELIDDWMFSQRIRSRGEAVRRLVTAGMVANLKQIKEARGSRAFADSLDDEIPGAAGAEPQTKIE